MRLITLSTCVAALICVSANFVKATELNEIVYDNGDTVAIEGVEAGAEKTANLEEVDEANTTPSTYTGRKTREVGEYSSCVTTNGFPGECMSANSCFPRLFPLNNSYEDTPKHTGVYNQNLAKILIESSGFCTQDGVRVQRSVPLRVSDLRSDLEICCAKSKRLGPFTQENSTATIDEEYLKKSCGSLKVSNSSLPTVGRIVGGRKAVLGEFPWMVAMLRRGQQFCGGSLVDNRNVLTAAHCVEFMKRSDVAALRLHIGDLDIYTTKETNHVERKAKRVLYHKGFSMKNLEHDIALIHLDKPVEFSKTIQPVCLHPGNPPYDTGKVEADVAGWGTTESGGSQSSSLLAVRLDVITQDDCNQKYAQAKKKIGPGMVCAGRTGKDSCQGDSGGPLVIESRGGQAKQIGIVSWGIGCASYPGVYTRVDKYMKWINKNKL